MDFPGGTQERHPEMAGSWSSRATSGGQCVNCCVAVSSQHAIQPKSSKEPERGQGLTLAVGDLPGFINVRWDNGEETLCRVGADGKYHLVVLERPAVVVAWAGGIGAAVNGRYVQVGLCHGELFNAV